MNLVSVAVEPGAIAATREDVLREAQVWLAENPAGAALFERFQLSSAVHTKRLAISPAEVRSLSGSKRRSEIFVEKGLPMLESAARRAIADSGVSPESFATVIFTSCTSPTVPAIDATLIPRLGLRSDVTRIPVYQHGCAGGVVALGLARQLVSPARPALILSLELCSLGFFPEDLSASGLVGAAIFADGAAASVVSSDRPGMELLGSRSILIPETEQLMGYDICDNGSHLRLMKELPGVVLAEVRRSLPEFLAEHGLAPKKHRGLPFSPGGSKILDHLEQELKITRDQCRWSWEVLQNVGNMSSTSISFVIRSYLDSNQAKKGDKVLVLGIGPGLTVQYVLGEI